ncbi:amidohydrolase [Zunongwangia sp. H14]|uniref:amidohydrolase family protein n=1 Tax=Zunongwangia sp. H14 TaxID=3240792 RepID=UPI00356688D4
MQIDAHQHFWKYDADRYGWIEDERLHRNFFPEDLKPLLDLHNFNGCIAVQADQSEAETRFLLKLAQQYTFIKAVIGWVDLSAENVEDVLGEFSENKNFKGVRHTIYDDRGEFMAAPNFRRGISKLAQFNLVYEILVFPYQLKAAVNLVNKFPEQRFVLNHMAKPAVFCKPSAKWISGIEELGRNKNVFCKISGLLSTAGTHIENKPFFTPILEVVFKSFSEDRLIFGSDWPVSLSGGTYADNIKLIENYVSRKDKNLQSKIFGINAQRCYCL